jgi:hypothetical protein
LFWEPGPEIIKLYLVIMAAKELGHFRYHDGQRNILSSLKEVPTKRLEKMVVKYDEA